MLYLSYVWHNRVLPVVYDYLLGQNRPIFTSYPSNISVGLVSDLETLAWDYLVSESSAR